MDGDLDYSSYTLEELIEAERTIDRDRFPLNFENLTRAIRAKSVSQPEDKRPGYRRASPLTWAAADDSASGVINDRELMKYAAIFVSAWFLTNVVGTSILEQFGMSGGTSLNLIYFTAAGAVVARRFVNKHQRIFTRSEYLQVFWSCYAAHLLFELISAVGFWFFVEARIEFSIGILLAGTFAMAIVLALNALLQMIAFRFPVRQIMIILARRYDA